MVSKSGARALSRPCGITAKRPAAHRGQHDSLEICFMVGKSAFARILYTFFETKNLKPKKIKNKISGHREFSWQLLFFILFPKEPSIVS
jgi:hypothetical protein